MEDRHMEPEKLPAYWPTRIILAIGIAVIAVDIAVILGAPSAMGGQTMSSGQAAMGLGLGIVGLAWMVRIFRGPRDQAAPWRHRGR
jgi:hypothetical protein